MLDHAPRLNATDAARLAHDLYGVDATARPLTSERDQNFLLETSGGERLVLKIANALEEPGMLDAQCRAMTHLATTTAIAPRVVATRDGTPLAETVGADGRRHWVWAVTHWPGVPLGRTRRRPPALLTALGSEIGGITRALVGFDHPALHRDFYWDLARGRQLVDEYRSLLTLPGTAVDTLIAEFDRYTAPLLPALRRSVIHGDLNDYNVLVDRGAVAGIVDFGDMVHSFTVGDLAIGAAYAVLDADDPLTAAAHVVRGYAARWAITETECAALFGLLALRLCTSACVAAAQQRQRPDNAYLGVSQAAIGRTLPALARVPFGLATAVFRQAAGFAPVPASALVVEWLRQQEFAPILDVSSHTILDLSVGSPLVSSDPADNAESAVTARIDAALRAADARVGIGRWDEARLLYSEPSFAGRTIHLGLDIFAPAGTPVHAPLRGVVHIVADNAAPLDYGPVVVLRHCTDDGEEFFTLYGHLEPGVAAGTRAGDRHQGRATRRVAGRPDGQ